jgi:pimeloyl-ACP methyl ester carboxylesterase
VASLSVGARDQPNTVFLSSLLRLLGPAATDQHREALRDILLELGASEPSATSDRLHDAVACREVVETNPRGFRLQDLELVPTARYCDDVELSRPFFATDWPVTTPTYYFQGTRDPNTPAWQAEVHFSAQPTALRELVFVENGGHNAYSINLTACHDDIWQAISAAASLHDALGACDWPTRLITAAPRTDGPTL